MAATLLLCLSTLSLAQTPSQSAREGVWLRNGVAEAFVMVKPFPRVVQFRRLGEASPLLDGEGSLIGARTWFMEPHQVKLSGRPAKRPARVVESSSRRALVEAEVDTENNLQVVMDVSLDAQKPVLHIKHGIRNVAKHPRTLAAWGIVSFATRGRFVIPYGASVTTPRTLSFFGDALPTAPNLTYGRDALAMNLAQRSGNSFLKIGVRSALGSAAHVDGKTALLVSSPPVPDANYPEGGANLTAFLQNQKAGSNWAELENVGPLTTVDAGRCVWLKQILALAQIAPPEKGLAPDAGHALLQPQWDEIENIKPFHE